MWAIIVWLKNVVEGNWLLSSHSILYSILVIENCFIIIM